MYSYRVELAIRAASVLHKDQLRKGSIPFPYITHLIATAFTLTDYTDDEDVIITALLHDTLEDTDYTSAELQEDFGGKVKDWVEAITEPKSTPERRISWLEKKKIYNRQLKYAPEEALMVAAADKIHNFRTIVEDYTGDPSRYVRDFGQNFADRIEAYDETSKMLNAYLRSPIKEEFNYVYREFKEFLEKTDREDRII